MAISLNELYNTCLYMQKQAGLWRGLMQSGDLMGDARGDTDGIRYLFGDTPEVAESLYDAYKDQLNTGSWTDGLYGRKGGITPMLANKMMSDISEGNDRGSLVMQALTNQGNNQRVQGLFDRVVEDYGKGLGEEGNKALAQAREAISIAPAVSDILTNSDNPLYAPVQEGLRGKLKDTIRGLSSNKDLKKWYGDKWDASFRSATGQKKLPTTPGKPPKGWKPGLVMNTPPRNAGGNSMGADLIKYMLPALLIGGLGSSLGSMFTGKGLSGAVLPTLLMMALAGMYGFGKNKGYTDKLPFNIGENVDNAVNGLWQTGGSLLKPFLQKREAAAASAQPAAE